MEDYKDIIELLKPRRNIKASDELRKKVNDIVKRDRHHGFSIKWLIGGISVSAVAAMLLVVLIPTGLSAKEVLREAIEALRSYENMEMEVEVRTRPVENFRYINVKESFITHRINMVASDSLVRWRVDKGERIAMGDGNEIYIWLPSLNLGWHLGSQDKENVLGYLANFLEPDKILERELNNCLYNREAEYKIERKDKNITLIVHSQPQGNYENPYMLNQSISDSESIRRYVFDADSKMLKSASVSIKEGNDEIDVLRVSSIDYASENKDICKLDDSVRFVEMEDQPGGLKGLNAEEAASTILNSFTEWNERIIDKVIFREVSDIAYRDRFKGSKLISIGKSFTSGNGNSVFVPYTLILPDGSLQRHNIALQKTEYGGWIVVGGL